MRLKILSILTMMVLGATFLILRPLYGETGGYKYYKNFSYMEYDHHPQNW